MIKSSLICKEEVLREKIYLTRKSSSLDPSWLADAYSTSLAEDLRYSISERLGWLGEKGWQHLKRLIDQEGIQPEFIYASGLCYQTEAKDWLFSQLNCKNKFQVETLQALSCWGGDFSIQLLKSILSEESQAIRLAGLEILKFKAHQINDELLIEILKEPISDFREAVVLKTIRILQRRDGIIVCNELAKIVKHSHEKISDAALIALGSIANTNSIQVLLQLSQSLENGQKKEMTLKQLSQQYR
ncbi:HEAT repeat domain-containing protein [Prochlorococcus marinus]|uniref:HEAT repeat domain-containing protein n=1 Tax=Prochlorococcus marinus TaxID=1219 RepID=UPI0022B2F224|nr:HEAT repeat domain-containing protein [Prochlorococcus marinus]